MAEKATAASEAIEVTPETILAVRLPIGIEDIGRIQRMAEKVKPRGTTLYVRGGGKWFFLEAR
jgi:hypothetical protein